MKTQKAQLFEVYLCSSRELTARETAKLAHAGREPIMVIAETFEDAVEAAKSVVAASSADKDVVISSFRCIGPAWIARK